MALDKDRQILVNGKPKHTREYRTWANIKDRCFRMNSHAYPRYGGRGIKVCDRWRYSFDNFLADMGKCPGKKFSIERLDNTKGYEPDNCIWADLITQANNKSSNHIITYKGRTETLVRFCKRYKLNYGVMWHQISRQKLSIDAAIKIQRNKYSRTPLTKERLYQLYIVEDMNCRQVSNTTKWSKKTVQDKLKEFDIPTNQFKHKTNKTAPTETPALTKNSY